MLRSSTFVIAVSVLVFLTSTSTHPIQVHDDGDNGNTPKSTLSLIIDSNKHALWRLRRNGKNNEELRLTPTKTSSASTEVPQTRNNKKDTLDREDIIGIVTGGIVAVVLIVVCINCVCKKN